MHEILTIQCGNTANYIGTHFWNFQDPTSAQQSSIDHDVLFSSGQSRSGIPTYTPRALLYDRARHFGAMARQNALFAEPDTQNDAELVQPEVIAPHAFQDTLEEVADGSVLERDGVRYWSDYNMQFYRPQSYLPLDSFATQSTDYQARFKDRDVWDSDIRPFMEECGTLKSFNLVTSMVDAWAGWTNELVLMLAAECPKTSKLFISTSQPDSRQQSLEYAETLLAIHDEVDVIVPLNVVSTWTSSARAGLWLDAITLPLRSVEGSLSLTDMTSFLLPGHKLFGASLSDTSLGPMSSSSRERQFMVARGRKETDLESKLTNGSLVTTYTHVMPPEYPASFPDVAKLEKVNATLDDSSEATNKHIKFLQTEIGGIRGAKGYSDRKDLLEELVEFQGRYTTELMESDDSSDDDGF